jgi:hypothetical protein
MPFGFKNAPPTYQLVVSTIFKEYLGVFMKLFLDGVTLISIQPKTTTILVATTPSLITIIEYLRVDVRVEEIKALVMEE